MSRSFSRYSRRSGLPLFALSTDELKKLVAERLGKKIHGICFSPYIEGQEPGSLLTEQQIAERLAIIQPYVNWIRTFSCTEGNELIPQVAKQMGFKTLVGVWLDTDFEQNELEMQNALKIANQGHVDLLAVGNEVLLREELSDQQLIDYIERAKASVDNIPVGYVDAYFLFVDHPAVTDHCDVVFANCYPFWEGYPAEHALIYMKDMYRQALQAGKGKKVIVSETGWPNIGTPERQSVPSLDNALRYFIGSYDWAEKDDIDMFYFSSFDEAWKVADEGDVGAYWGLWDNQGNLKYV